MKNIIIAISLLFTACSSYTINCGGDPKPPIDAASIPDASIPDAAVLDGGIITINLYQESQENFLNPERGFYTGVKLTQPAQMATVRAGGHSLAFSLVRLDEFRDAPLTQTFLNSLTSGFAAARAAGIKIVLRFSYNSSASADAPLSVILGHIQQLQPLFQANSDVIAVVQAGFIGAWGEWHGSTNGLDTQAARTSILTSLLQAVPESRYIQIRTPMLKENVFPGGPLLPGEALGLSGRARVGHHNDCFLASDTDYGTYANPVANWKDHVAQDTKYTPMGGETCKLFSPRSDCPTAVNEMKYFHWSYLNQLYNQAVLAAWAEQGCYPDVQRQLGYRFVVRQAYYQPIVKQTGSLTASIHIDNIGYAAPYNKRALYAVMTDSIGKYVFMLTDDVRRWLPETGALVQLDLPLEIVRKGEYKLSLWLPDESATLRSDSRYAIRFANEAMWDPISGENVLATIMVE